MTQRPSLLILQWRRNCLANILREVGRKNAQRCTSGHLSSRYNLYGVKYMPSYQLESEAIASVCRTDNRLGAVLS